ncbi:MAG: choice-of-anchor D domain-containing protein, partial [Terracidiphilus sp.]
MCDQRKNLRNALNHCLTFLFATILCFAFPSFAAAQTTVSPASVNFGNVAFGESSAIVKVTLKNTQAVTLNISSIAVSGPPYALDPSTTCANPGTLASGASCTIGLTLTPAALGAAPAGMLTIHTDATNSPQNLALSGTGVAPTTLSASSLNFNSVVVGEPSAPLGATLKNNQLIPLNIAAITLPAGGYALGSATTCANPGPLAAGASCVISIVLTPAALGAVPAGSMVVTTDASNSPLSVVLTGTGIVPIHESVSSLSFGNVPVGVTSAIETITILNEQKITANIASITAPAGGYAIDPSSTCANPGPLAAGASCIVAVTFTPGALGAAPAGAVIVTTDASNSPMSITVSGTGATPTTLSATSLAFGNQVLGATSPIKTFTLKNNQLVNLNISSITPPAGGYAIDPSTTCANPGPLASGATCTIAVTFTPAALGAAPA